MKRLIFFYLLLSNQFVPAGGAEDNVKWSQYIFVKMLSMVSTDLVGCMHVSTIFSSCMYQIFKNSQGCNLISGVLTVITVVH